MNRPHLPFRKTLVAVSLLTVGLAASFVAGCSESVTDLYASIRAFFRYDNVTASHQLYTALNSPGEFCTVTLRNSVIYFTDADGRSSQGNLSATEAYGKTQCVAGFIVGTPSVPDLNGQTAPRAYDLVCPTCYERNAIQRSLQFDGREQVKCPRCSRTYSLQTGLQTGGDEGVSILYRYRMMYSSSASGTLVINN